MRPDKETIQIEAAEGRVANLPNGGLVERGKTYAVLYSPQIKRMLKDGDIQIAKKKKKEGDA